MEGFEECANSPWGTARQWDASPLEDPRPLSPPLRDKRSIFLISSGSSKKHSHFCLCLALVLQKMLPASAEEGKGNVCGGQTHTDIPDRQCCLRGLLSFASTGLGVAPEGMWARHPHLHSEQPEGPPVCPPSPSTGSELPVPGFVSGLERHRTHPRSLS